MWPEWPIEWKDAATSHSDVIQLVRLCGSLNSLLYWYFNTRGVYIHVNLETHLLFKIISMFSYSRCQFVFLVLVSNCVIGTDSSFRLPFSAV